MAKPDFLVVELHIFIELVVYGVAEPWDFTELDLDLRIAGYEFLKLNARSEQYAPRLLG